MPHAQKLRVSLTDAPLAQDRAVTDEGGAGLMNCAAKTKAAMVNKTAGV